MTKFKSSGETLRQKMGEQQSNIERELEEQKAKNQTRRKPSMPGLSSKQRRDEKNLFPISEQRGRKGLPPNKSPELPWDEVREENEKWPNKNETRSEEPSYNPFENEPDSTEEYRQDKHELPADEDSLRKLRAGVMEAKAKEERRRTKHHGIYDGDKQLSVGKKDLRLTWAKNQRKKRRLVQDLLRKFGYHSTKERTRKKSDYEQEVNPVSHYIDLVNEWEDDPLKRGLLKSLNDLTENNTTELTNQQFDSLVQDIQAQVGDDEDLKNQAV